MRCARAQQWMAAAVDDELGDRRQRKLDRHLERCAVCRAEMAGTTRLLGVLAALPAEAAVSAPLAQATLRRVRLLAADEDAREATTPWWRTPRIPVLALGSAMILVLAIGLVRRRGEAPIDSTPVVGRVAKGPAAPSPSAKDRLAARAPEPVAAPPQRRVRTAVPAEPPAALAAAPDLFIDLPILRNLEKLQNFDAIRTTTLEDDASPADDGEDRSNG